MWSDSESNLDYLNFSEISESIADIIESPELLPVSIGVFGNWGAGKSTILKLTEEQLNTSEKDYLQVSFDAWMYQGYDDAKASILEAIADALLAHVAENEGLREKAVNLCKRVNKIRALGLALDIGTTAAGIPSFGAFGGMFNVIENSLESDEIDTEKLITETVGQMKAARKQTKGFLNSAEDKSPPKEISAFRKEYSELLDEIDRPLVVYIDNLDRCIPVNAIHTLEAIRLFLFLPKTAFVIAADEEMIRTAVQQHHKGANERHQADYLDKLIQVPINVPKPGVLEIRSYLMMLFANNLDIDDDVLNSLEQRLKYSLRNSWKEPPIEITGLVSGLNLKNPNELIATFEMAQRITPLLANSSRINGNPRIVKRLLNVIRMRKKVADRRGMNLDESIITKLVIFERCAGNEATLELYKQIDKYNGFPESLKKLEEGDLEDLPDSWKNVSPFISGWSSLTPQLSNVDLRAAAYLSRETIPLGMVSGTMSSVAKELVTGLSHVKTRTSASAKKLIEETPKEDLMSVMDELISALRTISAWEKKPQGLDGAIMLALTNDECKSMLNTFLSTIPTQKWLNPILKELN